ncbi:hypothetical protein [Erythrobacter crassostreae]|uniref:Uncharacterized protein n=1 Tax=Erythrobacter crassostreae TaxID=2828328 RepID=A0A9X1F1G8_9SPHN|nr:hypothetical protein [Erythrobacter crassostrea]MBV7258276.1 hypothetical protein [Erythrobacter crassostrea]
MANAATLFSGIVYGQVASHDAGTDGDWFVDGDNGDDTNTGTSTSSAFETVGAAIGAADASNGDQTVRIMGHNVRYREEVDYIWNGGGPTSLSIKAYGSDRPVISGAEPLTGWTNCGASDANTVGPNWPEIHKVTVNTADFPAPKYWRTLMTESGSALKICGLRRADRSFPDFFFDNIDQTISEADETDLTFGLREATYYDTIAHPSLLGGFTDTQLEQTTAIMYAFPNIAYFQEVTSVFGQVLQLEQRDFRPNSAGENGAYALLNVLPAMQRGEWGYQDHGNGTVTFYVWPRKANNLTGRMELAVRTRGLRIYRSLSDTPCAIEGINFEMFAGEENGGLPLGLDGLSDLTGNTATIKHCQLRLFAGEKGMEIKFQEQGVEIENVTFRDGIGFGMQTIAATDKPLFNYRIRNCQAQDLSQTGFRMFGVRDCVMTDIRSQRTSGGGHANAINFYSGCDKCVVLNYQGGVQERDRLYEGYGTNQRSSNIYFLHSTFSPASDGRGYVDQSNAGGIDQPNIGEGGGLINCWVPDMPDRRGSQGNGGIAVGRDIMPWAIYNCVAPAIVNTGGTVERKGNILTNSSVTGDPSEALGAASGENAIYADVAASNWRSRAGSPLTSATGTDASAIILSLEGWFPNEDFRRDANGKVWNPANPGVGPFGTAWPETREQYAAPQVSLVPTEYLVQGSTAGYFVDPSNVPSGTARLTFRGRFRFPTASLSGGRLFSQESTGCDFNLQNDGSVRAGVEDGTGAKMLNNDLILPAGTIVANQWLDIEFDVDQLAGQAIVSVNGSTTTTAFTGAGSNGLFQSSREVSFLATSGGGGAVPQGTEIADLEVDFDGVLHKAISNAAVNANSDNWHRGGEFAGQP